jgi:hypothetical protein
VPLVTGILSHVILWFNKDWTFPEKAIESQKNFQWDTKVWDVVFVNSQLSIGGARGYGADNDILDLARKFIQYVWHSMETEESWKDNMVKKEVYLL